MWGHHKIKFKFTKSKFLNDYDKKKLVFNLNLVNRLIFIN